MDSLCSEYDVFAEFYDYVLPYRERQDVRFFVDLACSSPGPVLEIGCGTGRVLLPCARSGATMVGLDVSPAMLEICRRKLADEAPVVQQRVQLVEADMRGFELARRFSLILLPFRSFQHLLTADDQLQALQTMHRHLTADGRFVLDVFNPALPFLGDERWLRSPLVEPPVQMPDGRTVVRSLRVTARDWFAQTQDIEIAHAVTWPDGRQEEHAATTRMRYIFRFEAEHLLVRAGFEIEALYGDYDKSPYGGKYPGELIFVARPGA